MNELQQLEKSLAELLGWTNVREENYILIGYTSEGDLSLVPRWTTDDAAAFQLMVEHGLCVYVDTHPEGCQCVEVEIACTMIIVNFDEYPDVATAVRVAIVKAVIAKLTAASGLVPTPCFGLEEAK